MVLMFNQNFIKISSAAVLLSVASLAQAAAVKVTTPININFSDSTSTVIDWNLDGLAIFKLTRSDAGTFPNIVNRIGLDPYTVATTVIVNTTGKQLTSQSPTATIGSGSGYVTDVASPIVSFNTNTLATGLSSTVGGFGPSAFTTTTSGDIGFKFIGSTGLTQYGWAHVTFTAGAAGGFTINSYGYETTANTPIVVGSGTVVPEPSSYALAFAALSLGFVSVRRLRNRKA